VEVEEEEEDKEKPKTKKVGGCLRFVLFSSSERERFYSFLYMFI
jgi:hypothetical protein